MPWLRPNLGQNLLLRTQETVFPEFKRLRNMLQSDMDPPEVHGKLYNSCKLKSSAFTKKTTAFSS
jgi:hypothetical protein